MPGASLPRAINASANSAGDAPLPSEGLRERERAGHRIRSSFAIHALAIHAFSSAATLTLMPFAHAGPPLLEFSRSEVVQTVKILTHLGLLARAPARRLPLFETT